VGCAVQQWAVLKAAPGFRHNGFITIMPQEGVGVHVVMGCTMDRPYLSWTDHLLRLKWIQIRSQIEAISQFFSHYNFCKGQIATSK
jgi:hypothetical protein